MQWLIIVRHGEYDEHGDNKSLNDAGRAQIAALAERIQPYTREAKVILLASPTMRARQSADILGDAIGVQPEVCGILSAETSYKGFYPQALEEVRRRQHLVDTLILVTHLEYAEEFPQYFIEQELGRMAPPQLSIQKGEGCAVDCAYGFTFLV
jgi:phosphohistidine phosphatase SixA